MIAFVTGSSGFVGSHLRGRLLAEGYTVRVLVARIAAHIFPLLWRATRRQGQSLEVR